MKSELRTSKIGFQQNWTKTEVLAGLKYFFELNARYPTAREIDLFKFLPSSRSIQRQFGGLVVLRQELIPDSHSNYTQGDYRSSIAKEANKRATQYEEEFYLFLCSHFDPVAVHEHKIMRPGNVASDFYIYLNEDKGVVIDLFYAKDTYSLRGIISIKKKRYELLSHKTIFVFVGNNDIDIQTVRQFIERRKIPLPAHILVDTEANFKADTVFQIKSLSKYSK